MEGNGIMKDIKRWFSMDEKPDRKGSYLLMIGERPQIGGFLTIDIIKTDWNGKRGWTIPKNKIPVKWKYSTPEDEKKYLRRK